MRAALVITTIDLASIHGYDGCAAIEAALGRVEGVEWVSVSLSRLRATVLHCGCDTARLIAAVAGAGYAAKVA